MVRFKKNDSIENNRMAQLNIIPMNEMILYPLKKIDILTDNSIAGRRIIPVKEKVVEPPPPQKEEFRL